MPKTFDAYLSKDEFAKSLGVELTGIGEDFARCEMDIQDHHKNGIGSLHGGVIFSLADISFAVACSQVDASIGIQADIKFLNRTLGKRLIAEARLISSSKKIGNYAVAITDEKGTHIAQFSSVCYRLPQNNPAQDQNP